MIVLVCGNAFSSISQKISQLKSTFDPIAISELNVRSLGWGQVVLNLSGGGLFDEKRLVILEDVDMGVSLDDIPDSLNLTVVLKFLKPLPATSNILKWVMQKKGLIFNLTEKNEVSIFPFLDALVEKRAERVLPQLDKLLRDFGGQYLLTMITFALRRLVATPKTLPPFVLNKIVSQKRSFTMDKIKNLYRECLETDFKVKSGKIDEKIGLTLLVEKILNT